MDCFLNTLDRSFLNKKEYLGGFYFFQCFIEVPVFHANGVVDPD